MVARRGGGWSAVTHGGGGAEGLLPGCRTYVLIALQCTGQAAGRSTGPTVEHMLELVPQRLHVVAPALEIIHHPSHLLLDVVNDCDDPALMHITSSCMPGAEGLSGLVGVISSGICDAGRIGALLPAGLQALACTSCNCLTCYQLTPKTPLPSRRLSAGPEGC